MEQTANLHNLLSHPFFFFCVRQYNKKCNNKKTACFYDTCEHPLANEAASSSSTHMNCDDLKKLCCVSYLFFLNYTNFLQFKSSLSAGFVQVEWCLSMGGACWLLSCWRSVSSHADIHMTDIMCDGRERLDQVCVFARVFSWHQIIFIITCSFTFRQFSSSSSSSSPSCDWTGYVQDILIVISMQSVTVSMRACVSDHWGSSVTGLFCLSVSMRDRTPRLTLVETRRVTESAGGACEQAF